MCRYGVQESQRIWIQCVTNGADEYVDMGTSIHKNLLLFRIVPDF